MTDKEKALDWWNSHKWLVHAELTTVYYGRRHWESLTDKEIIHIWRQENSK